MTLAGAALLLVLSAGPGRAPTVEASQLMAEGEFDQALKKLDAAIAKEKAAAPLAKLQIIRGQCLLALGDAAKARQAFIIALKKDPTVELDAAKASPDAVDLFEKARAEFPGVVAITVDGKANVRIDGKAMGPAPLTLELPSGTHTVDATATDGRASSKEFKVRPGRKTEVTLELPTLTVSASPVVGKNDDTPPPPPPLVVTAPTVESKGPRGRTIGAITALAGGAIVTGAGIVSFLQANDRYQLLKTGRNVTPAQQLDARTNGPVFATLGWVGVGLGTAAIATGIVLLLLPSGSEANVGALLGPDGAVWLAFGGRFP